MRILFGLLIVAILVLMLPQASLPLLRAVDEAWHYANQRYQYYQFASGKPLRGTPDLGKLKERLAAVDAKLGNAVFLRIFKKESELELWLRHGTRYRLFATYPICAWSGNLGPKLKQGDHQSPEGFYTVGRSQLNPNSKWHLSFNLGYPNVFDRVHGRTGDFLMVHGGCGSIGCYAVTDPVIEEIWKLINAAFNNGQPRFHVHVFPFRVTAWNKRLHGTNRWYDFWNNLREGERHFEAFKRPPVVSVCKGRYGFRRPKIGAENYVPLRQDCS